jgi:hypothetical protein
LLTRYFDCRFWTKWNCYTSSIPTWSTSLGIPYSDRWTRSISTTKVEQCLELQIFVFDYVIYTIPHTNNHCFLITFLFRSLINDINSVKLYFFLCMPVKGLHDVFSSSMYIKPTLIEEVLSLHWWMIFIITFNVSHEKVNFIYKCRFWSREHSLNLFWISQIYQN